MFCSNVATCFHNSYAVKNWEWLDKQISRYRLLKLKVRAWRHKQFFRTFHQRHVTSKSVHCKMWYFESPLSNGSNFFRLSLCCIYLHNNKRVVGMPMSLKALITSGYVKKKHFYRDMHTRSYWSRNISLRKTGLIWSTPLLNLHILGVPLRANPAAVLLGWLYNR